MISNDISRVIESVNSLCWSVSVMSEKNGHRPDESILQPENLPNELILKMFGFLETRDLIICGQLGTIHILRKHL